MKEKRKYLYVLLLENDFYYIGQTNDLVRRFREHYEQIGGGSIWTYLHKPIKIIEHWDLGEYTQESAMQFENKLTLEYINRFGMEKVRGGEYVMTDPQLHYYSLLSRNRLIKGQYIPKLSEEGIMAFVKLKQLVELVIEDERPYIFVLELEENRVYVNRSTNIKKDLYRHFFRKGSLWSDKYRPIGIHEITDDLDLGLFHPKTFQNSIVKKYMLKYGWQNVRGGDFKIIDEKEHHRLLLKNMPDAIVTNTADEN